MKVGLLRLLAGSFALGLLACRSLLHSIRGGRPLPFGVLYSVLFFPPLEAPSTIKQNVANANGSSGLVSLPIPTATSPIKASMVAGAETKR